MDEADVSVQAVTHKVLKTKLPPLKIFYHDLMIKNWRRIKLFIQEEMHWIFMKSLFAELPFSWLKRVINAVSQFRGGLGVVCFLHLVNSSVC